MTASRLPIRALTLALALSAIQPIRAATLDPGWPREVVRDGATLTYYQPQIDDWTDFKQLTGRMAINITPPGGKPQVGVVTLQTHTDVDIDSRNALLSNPQIVSTAFPGADQATSQKLDQLVREFLNPQASLTLSVDRLVASVESKKAPPVAEVKNDPPAIFVSYGPAILLVVDGEPTLAPIQDSDLSFVVNANWPLFTDNASHQYYLFTGQSWMTSTDPKSGWAETKVLPATMSKVPSDPTWADLKPYIPPPKAQKTKAPGVFFSSAPAELIAFGGQPVYAPIPGTGLVFAKNTESDVFVFSPTKTFYYLTGGRWFSAPALGGPWTFATNQLPPDFAKIPRDSAAAWVLSSVPGTPEAADAVLLAQIPTTVEVDPAAAASEVKVSYNGEPEFQPIEGTALAYATNTPDKVIKVDNRYYVCTKGVWFDASSPAGPWQTTTSVPPVIYTIPPSSPVYNVTYVTQQVTPSGSVQASYTAGYVGAFIVGAAVGAIIANGNGYYYPPYIARGPGRYPVYYPRPVPYGYRTYNPYTGASGVRGGAYGPNGSAQWGTSYNPNTGTYARGAAASGRYGSAGIAQAYNPYTGAYAATRQGSNAYGQWGSSVVTKGNQWAATQHTTTASGTVGTYQNSAGGKAITSTSVNGRAAAGKTANGDMYAGRDGSVYKNTNGSWQKYDNGSWSSVNKPTPKGTQPTAQSVQQPRPTTTQANNSATAQQRTQSSQQQRPAPSTANRPSGGTPQNTAGGYSRPSGQVPVSELNKDMQNRHRGAAQSRRYTQTERGGGGFRR
ncbi:hypothetical protein BLL42_01305 [Pseudomonas frederiksbergensis]|uniref:Carbohydrate-binding family V/XII n=1 Tax=Pseudomonas frederiksbergensis TaxID=104087 RepID=A0A1J0EEM1_9PSED|nr:hypothetical protein [Pseudomonas frederiksbergensis]APC14439.1 hypothetical protein BLL42_01305 [Pseudomonas frederiksbergensis]